MYYDKPKPKSNINAIGNNEAELNGLLRLRDNISANSNSTEILLNLIGLGDKWWETECSETHRCFNMNDANEMKEFTQVPGCMAKVHLKIVLDGTPSIVSACTEGNDKGNGVTITGMADARVARGMLAFFIKVRGANHTPVTCTM